MNAQPFCKTTMFFSIIFDDSLAEKFRQDLAGYSSVLYDLAILAHLRSAGS